MWILHSVYAIHLAEEIIDSTGMEAQRLSFSNVCKSKDFIKSCLPLFKMEQLLVLSVSSRCVTLHARLNVTISNRESLRQ